VREETSREKKKNRPEENLGGAEREREEGNRER
jgi:hypothetical protein